MVSCEARCLPKQLKGKRGIGGCKERGPQGPFSFAWPLLHSGELVQQAPLQGWLDSGNTELADHEAFCGAREREGEAMDGKGRSL